MLPNTMLEGLSSYPGKYPGVKIFHIKDRYMDKYMSKSVQAFTDCKDTIVIREHPKLNIHINDKNDKKEKDKKKFTILNNTPQLDDNEAGKLVEKFILEHEHQHIADPSASEKEVNKRAMEKIKASMEVKL